MHSLFKIPLYLFFLLSIPINVSASYSDIYDEALNALSITDPKLAITTTKQQLVQAKLQGDHKRQLVLYFYMAESYSTLSSIIEMDSTIAEGLKIAREHNDIRFISEFMGLESYVLVYQGELRKASLKANKALQFAKETDDYRLIASMLSIRAQAHLSTENYSLALKDTESAITIFKEYNDRENLNKNYNLLALIYDSLTEYEKAIKYYDVSMAYDDSGSLYNKATMYFNIGSTYSFMGDNKKAIENLYLAMDLSNEIKDKATLAYAQFSLADLFVQDNKIVEAEKMALQAMDWFSANEDLFMFISSNIIMAEINIKKIDFKQAKEYIDVIDKQLQSIATPRMQLSVLWVKIQYFAKQELWKEAYELSQESIKARSDIYNKDKESSIEEMKLKYNTQFDQEKMASLQKQNQLQQEVIVQAQSKQLYFLGLMALTVVMMMGFYYAYRKQAGIKRKLYLLSIKDDLTQVANRRYILELLGNFHAKSLAENKVFTLVMVDLDNFKAINDKYGHFKGNEVLIQFAKVAKYTLPEGCEVGRLGGEEWLLLMPNINQQQSELILRKLRKNYNNPQLVNLSRDHQLHFSSGVKTCEGDCLDIEHILREIDSAMYTAKEKGRNQDVYC